MLELVAGQYKNTELQAVFNQNSDLRNKPTEFLVWVNRGLNPQLIIFLHKFKCSPGMRDHIRDYMPTISKTTLSELSGGQAYDLRNKGQPKCKNGHVFNSHWGPSSTICQSQRAGAQCMKDKSP